MATVLLIEPHADSARSYTESLQRAGFRVETTIPEVDRQDLAPLISVPRAERPLLRVVTWSARAPQAHYSRMNASTSLRLRSIRSRVTASRFSRSIGSVLDARTLKCQSGYSAETPSS